MEFEDVTDGMGNVVATHIVYPFVDPIIGAMGSWKKTKEKIDEWLARTVGPARVDEVALMFEDKEKLHEFVEAAVKEPGVKLFNVAQDHVQTSPILSEYWVSYYFLEVEDLGMRVEVMYIERGTSPLHESFLSYGYNPTFENKYRNEPVVVHFSFKVPRTEYGTACSAMGEAEAELVQSCESTYGRFAYYRHELFGQNLYVKPRVNLRDEEEFRPDAPNTADRGEFGMTGLGTHWTPPEVDVVDRGKR